MHIALLGSGTEVIEAGMSLFEAGHTITHVGPSSTDGHDNRFEFFIKKGAKLVATHHDLLENGVRHILMCSYAPLIKKDELARASFFNIHFAILPKYRGYHGFIWSIINDEKEVGYTLHLVDEGIDSGPIYHQGKIHVSDSDDVFSLKNKIQQLIRQDVGKIFHLIEEGKKPTLQDHLSAIYVTRRSPDEGEIDWNWPARRIFNLVRAVKPPYTLGAYTYYNSQKLILYRTHCLPNPSYFSTVGKTVAFLNDSILVKCGDSILSIDEIEFNGVIQSPRQIVNKIGVKLGK